MILLDIQPGELARGYAGGIEFVNRLPAFRFADTLRAKLRTNGYEPADDSSLLEMLALASGLDAGAFVSHHTMLSTLRFAAKPGACEIYAASTTPYHLRHGLMTPRPGAYACVECIREDLQSETRSSWFRRIHHLIGVDWCHIHGIELHRVNSDSPFSAPPHIWQRRGALEALNSCAASLANAGEFIDRFVRLSVATLDREKPTSSLILKRRLRLRAASAGLRLAVSGAKPPLSDLVRSLAPKRWVEQHIQGLDKKEALAYFSRVDDFLFSGTPAATDSYMLAMAALFSSAEEAMADIDAVESFTNEEIKERRALGNQFWNGDAWALYMHHKGDLGLMSERLNIHRGQLGQRMASIGLPHLRGGAISPVWAALEDFGAGMSVPETCELHHVEIEDLYDVLRQAGARLINAVTQFRREALRTRNSRLRPRRKSSKMPAVLQPTPS